MAATLQVNYFNTFWLKKIKSITDVETVTGIIATNTAVNTTQIDITNTTSKTKIGAGQIVTNVTNVDSFASGVVTVVGRSNLAVTVSTPALSTTTNANSASAASTLTLTTPNANVIIGMEVSGTGVVAGTYIIAAPTPGSIFTLNQAATIALDEALTYVSSINIIATDDLTFTGIAADSGIPNEFVGVDATDWYIEEARIRGGYNNTSVDFGVKAYLVEDTFKQQHRISSMIYSGIFNSRTGVNNTNQFSVAENITRSADPANGSIQRLYAEDTNLIIFQEDKVSRALIDKDAIYSAEGSALTTSGAQIIGQIIAYAGEYGIATDPESFAVYGNRKYFTDRKRGVVLRLSSGVGGGNGITEVSSYGMHDFFRDSLASTSISKIVGGWDMHTKNYTISIQEIGGAKNIQQYGLVDSPAPGTSVTIEIGSANTDIKAGMYIFSYTAPGTSRGKFYGRVTSVTSSTLFVCDLVVLIPANTNLYFQTLPFSTATFDEGVLGWTSFLTYNPTYSLSLNNSFYTFGYGKLYQHYLGGYGEFYGLTDDSNVTIILNSQPSVVKNFKTINYEGAIGWELESMTASSSDQTLPITKYVFQSNLANLENQIWSNTFKRKENKYFANLINNSPATEGEIVWGASSSGIKGFWSTVKMKLSNVTYPTTKKELFSVSSDVVESSY